jgi:hypothetical protein
LFIVTFYHFLTKKLSYKMLQCKAIMTDKNYNFQNPVIRKKASQKASVSQRPKTYRTRRKRVEEVEKELIKEELLKKGFIEQIGAILPEINDALIASALQPNSSGASDRRIIYTALKIIAKDKEAEPEMTMGQVLAELAKS